MKILITGGPVHANLDDVKIITNKFRGGLMADLADKFCCENDVEVTYLTTHGAVLPNNLYRINVVNHNGFDDYRQLVQSLCGKHDVVILGAAVANLIPFPPFKGKFPSHNFNPGDVITIPFTIAPRIIDDVKKLAPHTHLFGFKLLSGVSYNELINAAYGVLLESKATAVFANDPKRGLTNKIAVTKERGEHPMDNAGIVRFVMECANDHYYATNVWGKTSDYLEAATELNTYAMVFKEDFHPTPEGYVFGTIAVRYKMDFPAFLTTGRGKKELLDLVPVYGVNHDTMIVTAGGKATLNAPLLDWIFKNNNEVKAIVHLHRQLSDLPTQEYAIPGTARDSQRQDVSTSFNIAEHGCFLLFNEENVRI